MPCRPSPWDWRGGRAGWGGGVGGGGAFPPADRRGMALAGTLTGIAGFVFAVLVGNFLFVG